MGDRRRGLALSIVVALVLLVAVTIALLTSDGDDDIPDLQELTATPVVPATAAE